MFNGPLDTTPVFPRPPEESIRSAMRDLLWVLANISPDGYPLSTFLVRALIPRGHATAEATWAIHECCRAGVLMPLDMRSPHRHRYVHEYSPPAGVELAKGVVHLDTAKNDLWGWLFFAINHERVVAERGSGEADTKPPKRRGRRVTTHPHDEGIVAAWSTGKYHSKKDLATALGHSLTLVKAAIERARNRQRTAVK